MKKNIFLALLLLCGFTAIQAQKNKKQTNKAAAEAPAEDKDWKPTRGDTRNPFDTNKVKQVKTTSNMEAEDTNELKPKTKADGLGAGDDPFGKQGSKKQKANGLSAGDDPFGKTNAKKKKPAVKKNGYANQEVNYIKNPGGTQNSNSKKPVKNKKELKPVGDKPGR